MPSELGLPIPPLLGYTLLFFASASLSVVSLWQFQVKLWQLLFLLFSSSRLLASSDPLRICDNLWSGHWPGLGVLIRAFLVASDKKAKFKLP